MSVVKNLRTNFRGFLAGTGGGGGGEGVGGGGEVLVTCGFGGEVEVGGAVCTLETPLGIRGTISGEIVGVDGVVGVGTSFTEELGVVFTGP